MNELQGFQIAAREDRFVNLEECGEGTLPWLRKEGQDAHTKTEQRLAIDSMLKSATIYRENTLGKSTQGLFAQFPACKNDLRSILPVKGRE